MLLYLYDISRGSKTGIFAIFKHLKTTKTLKNKKTTNRQNYFPKRECSDRTCTDFQSFHGLAQTSVDLHGLVLTCISFRKFVCCTFQSFEKLENHKTNHRKIIGNNMAILIAFFGHFWGQKTIKPK